MNKTLEYHLDFEFVEHGLGPTPLSIGIKCEDGRSLYLVYTNVSNDFLFKLLNDEPERKEWLLKNVLSQVFKGADQGLLASVIKSIVYDFFNVPDTKAQIITYWGAYDWVLLCQLFGGMMSLPDFIMPQPIDIYQSAFEAGIEIPDRLKTWENEHHALADACAQEKIWTYVKNVKKGLR